MTIFAIIQKFHYLSSMSSLHSDLNDRQKEAVHITEGPLLIIAGAGSGKTRALTCRIAHLIAEKSIAPYNILAVTFTNKAAMEMKTRLCKLLNPNTEIDPAKLRLAGRLEAFPWQKNTWGLPTIGTFHAVCVQILKKHIHLLKFSNTFNIYDTADQKSIIKNLMEKHGINTNQYHPVAILGQISAAKSELITSEQYSARAMTSFTRTVADLYKVYQKALCTANALDFDDIIMKTVELLEKMPDILQEYQERFRYISVDEYQDTNRAQYVLINMLAKKYKNLCVIGDEDQSIYSWRGADIRNILDFEKDYPTAKVIKLEQNYRSTQVILDTAHEIIVKNKNRKEKKLWTEKKEGQKVRVREARDEREEAEFMAKEILDRIKRHEFPSYTDFVILYRTNAQSRVLEEVFMRFGIPYRIVGGVKFYERKEIKDILAYLKITQNPNDLLSLLRVINTPPRNIGDKTLAVLQQFASERGLNFHETVNRADEIGELPEGKRIILQKFGALWNEFRKANSEMSASGVLKTIIHRSGYKDFLLHDDTAEGEERWENIRELVSVATKYDALEHGISLSTFLEEVALIADLDTLDPAVGVSAGDRLRENAVTFMTLHSAKGLEFPCVFICGLEEGLFPHSRSLFEPEQMEEERRLMYVGVTRAMEDLFLLHARQRMLYGDCVPHEPSRFLGDIPEDLLEREGMGVSPQKIDTQDIGKRPVPFEEETSDLRDGDRVRHTVFGEGMVVQVIGGIAVIAFQDPKIGIKKVAISIAPMEKM
ncbi:UvrD-helicase domain-containing protein [Candidatus Peregrinibacteria bacterium]|nr:UvrD-helicase domain-containing protein [Candidatus Peregrinibacteria bacterium]